MTVCHQALRSTVPTRGDVFCEGRIIVEASATAQVSEFNDISRNKDVLSNKVLGFYSCYLRLDVAVENGVLVHVLDSLEELVDVTLDA